MNTFTLFFKRECQLLFRNTSVIGQPLSLFVLIALLFPFSVPADALGENGVLSQFGGSVIWIAVLLALMLSLESLFKDDLRDGLIEQWLIGHRSLALGVLGKVAAHWCTTGLALVLMAPLIAVTYSLDWGLFSVLALSLFLGTPSILLIGAIGAALTVTLERSGLLITVVTLPLTIPVLIFGASSLGSSAQGFNIATEMYALGAIAVLCITLAPLAIAAALRLTVEQNALIEDIVFSILNRFYHQLGSPKEFYPLSNVMTPLFGILALLLFIPGAYLGLVVAPSDYQQGDSYRIIFVHVPAAWLSLMIYMIMAVAAAIALIWRMKMAFAVVICSAPIGAVFTALALITGSLWAKPTWGAWWVWDARLTFELILLFLYMGIFSMYHAFDERRIAERATALLTVVGVVIIPIIRYSVEWWSSLHQGESVFRDGGPAMPWSMLTPLLLMAGAASFYYGYALFLNLRAHVLEQNQDKQWVQELAKSWSDEKAKHDKTDNIVGAKS